ncbi:MAG: response regulator transcription factor [Phycisphaerales bacterium]
MQRRPRVLVVDDEPDLVDLVSMNLEGAGYDVLRAGDGLEGLHAARAEQPDLVILDVMMPEMSGVEVARRLRADPRTSSTPVLMLTARASEGDQVSGLASGADDYITKPFSMRVLLARVEAALRRAPKRQAQSVLRLASVEVNLETHEAFTNGERAPLTPTEFRLLAALIDAGGRVLNRDALIEKGMGPGVAVTDRAIDVHVAALRKKLGPNSWLIRTVRGVGYRATAEREDGTEGS